MSFWGYTSAADRREEASRQAARLKKSGRKLEPGVIQGQQIARSFWGKAWCTHLESFSDYYSRLQRGRAYARNGAVLHLGITPGNMDALVSGSTLYEVSIAVKPLAPAQWQAIKEKC